MTSYADNIILYQAVNAINGKKYIGISKRGLDIRAKRHRWTAHSGGGAVIGAAIRKYGHKNIKFSTLVVCPTWEYAKELEVKAIEAFKPEYNLTKGGDGVLGFKLSDEAKSKISAVQKGNKHWLGKKHGPEAKRKMSLSRLAGIGGPLKGKPLNLSPEQRGKRRQRMLGKRFNLGRKHTPEAIAKMRIALAGNPSVARKIICLDTGQIFNSVTAAAAHVKRDRKAIYQMCHGQRKSVTGLKFQYI